MQPSSSHRQAVSFRISSLGSASPQSRVQLSESCGKRSYKRYARRIVRVRADLNPAAVGIAAAVLPIAGILGWRLSLYSQMEVITAQMVGRFVPKDAKQVVQLGGTTRDLFYYPKSTRQVTVVGSDITPGLFEQAGIQASMPCLAKKQPASNLAFIPDRSIDAMVCIRSISQEQGGTTRRQQILAEAIRVLKPGAPFIFLEPLTDGASPFRGLVSSVSGAAMEAETLEDLLELPELDVLQVDVALQGSDPHAVGLARRTERDAQTDAGLERAVSRKQLRTARKGLAADKGFKARS